MNIVSTLSNNIQIRFWSNPMNAQKSNTSNNVKGMKDSKKRRNKSVHLTRLKYIVKQAIDQEFTDTTELIPKQLNRRGSENIITQKQYTKKNTHKKQVFSTPHLTYKQLHYSTLFQNPDKEKKKR